MEGAALSVSIIALVISAVGWFVASWLNARTQKQALMNSLTNEARITLIDAIRDFHDWCSRIQITASSMSVDDVTSRGQTTDHHEARSRQLRELSIDPRPMTWLRRLEEYEPLFPATAHVRIEFLDMLEKACKAARLLADQHGPGTPPRKDDRDAFEAEIMDVLALSWDLLIHVQNLSIGRITGNIIAERVPRDPSCIRLVTDSFGSLSVFRPKSREPNKDTSHSA